MKILNLAQGSAAWKAARKEYKTASEASIITASSKNVGRDELLHMKATGTEQEFSEWFEKHILEKGHAVEAAARPFAEKKIAEKFGLNEDDAMLFPVTSIDDTETYLASCDGLTFDGCVGWECKQWNEEKAAAVRAGMLPECDKWQVAHQILTTGAEHWLYTVSDGTEEGSVHLWVTPADFDFTHLVAAWDQFGADLRAYKVPEVKAEIVADEVTALPAVSMIASGQVSVVENFAIFEKGLTVFLQEKLIREPKTDADFATLDLQIKALKKAEDMLKAAGESVLAQVNAVDTAMKKKDSLAALVRDNRLMAEKLLKTEKDRRRAEIAATAQSELTKHVDALSALVGCKLPFIAADFAEAMKGKKTIDSLQSSANDELARAKIEATRAADLMHVNMVFFAEHVTDETRYLFHDIGQLLHKQPDDFTVAITARLAQHEAQMRAREEAARAKAEAEAARAKAEAEAAAKAQAIATPAAVEQTPAPANDGAQMSLIASTTQATAASDDDKLISAVTEWAKRNNVEAAATMELRGIITGYLSMMKRRNAA